MRGDLEKEETGTGGSYDLERDRRRGQVIEDGHRSQSFGKLGQESD